MKKKTIAGVTVLALLTTTGWAALHLQAFHRDDQTLPRLMSGFVPQMSELEQTRVAIEREAPDVLSDPRSAAGRAALAGMYLQRSREGGGFEDYGAAEEMARQSLRIRVTRNSSAARLLAASLLAQHRFLEAHEVARELVRVWPEEPAHRGLLAELEMELGNYAAARVALQSLLSSEENLSAAPRLARWAELVGDVEEERRLLHLAADRAMYRSDLPREQVAWFHLRVAEHELRYGRWAETERAIRAGLEVEPGDFRLAAVLVRLEAERGNLERAIEYSERLGESMDLRTLAAIGDVYARLGRPEDAERYYLRLEKSAAENPEPFNRQWTQFRVDHGRALPETVALLREEIGTRRDVLGHDLLAWGLYRTGSYAEAETQIRQALRMGTASPTFLLHAAAIARAAGDDARADARLKRAESLHPRLARAFPELVTLARRGPRATSD